MIVRFRLTVDTDRDDVTMADLVTMGQQMIDNWQYEGVIVGLSPPALIECVPLDIVIKPAEP